jgi:tetratricopeptide (TPR) repeat protein
MIHLRGRETAGLVDAVLALLLLTTNLSLAFVETRAYQPAVTFGQEGRDEGQLRQPGGVTVDNMGRLYVADTYNHRIQVFAADGRFLYGFGSEGTQRGALSRPKSLAWGPNQRLYVAESGNHRVQVFDLQGQVVQILGGFGSEPGQFNALEGLAVEGDGTLYVADTLNHRVQKFAPDGRFLLAWGSSGSGKGEFLAPTAITHDRDGRVLVTDTQNHRVQVFTAVGDYLWEIGKAGRGIAEFDSPRGIASDAVGRIYVADTGNGRIQIFDRTGHYVAQVGHLGKRPGEFYYPAAVGVDGQLALYIADTVNHRLQVLTYFPALARMEQGWQAFQSAQLDEALAAWHDALSLDPSLAEAMYGVGLAYARQGHLDLAIDHLKAALTAQPGYAEARWALYWAYVVKLTVPLIALGLIVGAIAGTLLIRRLRRRVLRDRARHFMEEGRIGDTIATYESLWQFNRNDLEVCKTLENLYEQEGLENKRQQVNEIIARLEPENRQALSYLGKQLFAERRFGEAQQTWERMLRQDPTWAEAYFYLGAVQAERNQHESALVTFQQALSQAITSLHPSGDELLAESGPVAESQLATLVDVWDKVLTQDTPYAQAYASFQQARQVLAQRHVTQGREHLQHDDARQALFQLRWVSALTPNDDAARALLREAQTGLTFEHGLRYYQVQDYTQALRCFRETLVLDPEHDKARRYLRYAQQCLEGGVSERFRHLDLGEREKN